MVKNSEYIYDNVIIGNKKYCKKAQVGVDLTISKIFSIDNYGVVLKNKTIIAPYTEIKSQKYENILEDGWFLKKGTYIIELNEGCKLSKNDTAYIIPRSSLNRNGVSIISALWDPGYTTGENGHMQVRLNVDNENGFYLEKNSRICQIIVLENENPTNIYNGQFQNGKQR